MIRVISFLALFLITLFTSPYLAGLLAFWYSLRYFAPELLILAAVVDASFGAVADMPYYTLGAFSILMVTMFIKRYIMIWN